MYMLLIEQIAKHVEFLGFGTLPTEAASGSVFWGTMPDSPDECIAVYSSDSAYAGAENGARIQIMTRGTSVRRAYALSQAIVEALVDFDGFLAGDGAHVRIDVENASAGLGTDAKKRELFSSNFRVYYCED